MAELREIVAFLDAELGTANVPDYSGALNGLQLENSGKVEKVVAAVDASLPVIRKAIDAGADLLVVHHGMFWHGAQKLVNAQYAKVKEAMDADLAIYSSHIPLDVHPQWGNNAQLAKRIGMNCPERYHVWKGIELGLKQHLDISIDILLERVEKAVGEKPHACRGRLEESVGTVGVITGGAGSEIQVMASAGIDTFITGEGPHWSFSLAEELGVNLIYGGHYATETLGVLTISDVLAERFSLEKEFVDHPTGL